jgi:hypothetical protein
MIDWSTCAAVEQNPERVSGAWVFRGTPAPLRAVLRDHVVETARKLLLT